MFILQAGFVFRPVSLGPRKKCGKTRAQNWGLEVIQRVESVRMNQKDDISSQKFHLERWEGCALLN